MNNTTTLEPIQAIVEAELKNPDNVSILVATTFRGLSAPLMRRAITEGMMRGFTFKDFLEKNIYAIPYSSSYSLVTSIDYSRKIGMRSGIVGKSAPEFEEKDGKIISCSVTVKRKIGEYIGEFTARVYLAEYTTGRNLWASKPRTMISKVAEMHALRMACPEELSQNYVEEELQKEPTKIVIDMEAHEAQLRSAKTMDDLKQIWASLPPEAKQELVALKDGIKAAIEGKKTVVISHEVMGEYPLTPTT